MDFFRSDGRRLHEVGLLQVGEAVLRMAFMEVGEI